MDRIIDLRISHQQTRAGQRTIGTTLTTGAEGAAQSYARRRSESKAQTGEQSAIAITMPNYNTGAYRVAEGGYRRRTEEASQVGLSWGEEH